MTVYAWPFPASRFEMRVLPNTRVSVGPYTPTIQVLDFMGERWTVRIDMPVSSTPIESAAREAFFDRLKGPAHQIALWHLRLPVPQGTMRDGAAAAVVNGSGSAVTVVNGGGSTVSVIYGSASVAAPIAQRANVALLRSLPGRTLLAGDMFGMAGELKRCMESVAFDSGGLAYVEFQPRARQDIATGTPVVWNKPTANFMLKSDGVPTSWVPGYADGASFDAIEMI